ncbi:hypothetical protein HDU76_002824 [Blyttiomyces sp. JEL0837]|nr:hypothetical protein HDU76_002824 [Blyttiomyces sp. JEL0837]
MRITFITGFIAALATGLATATPMPAPDTAIQSTPAWSPYYKANMTAYDWMNVRYSVVDLVSKGFGPVLLRLAWHDAATGNWDLKTGGPHATINVQVPADPANKGLARAIHALAPVYEKFDGKISQADLWSFAGAVAVKAMGGPTTKWRPGRNDLTDISQAKLTDANAIPNPLDSVDKMRKKFQSMRLNDTDVAALLLGGHGVGRCHREYSGYHSSWTGQENTFSNFYNLQPDISEYKLENLTIHGGVHGETKIKSYQYNGVSPVNGVKVMQLPSDVTLVSDPAINAALGGFGTTDAFFPVWSDAFGRLLETNLDPAFLGDFVSTDPAASV